MHQVPTPEELELWIGKTAVDKDENKIGKIADVYIDDTTGRPEWIAVVTGLFGTRISFVPIAGAKIAGDDVRVTHEKSTVKDSPNIDVDGELDIEEEERLYRHYGLRYGAAEDLGAVSVSAEVTPAMARRRLRRRDSASVDFIDLESDGSSHDKHAGSKS